MYTDDAESNCHQRIHCFDKIRIRFRSCSYSIIVCSIIHCSTSQTHCKQSNQLCPNIMSKVLVVSQEFNIQFVHACSIALYVMQTTSRHVALKRPLIKSLTLTASKPMRTYVPTFITQPHSQCRQTQWHTYSCLEAADKRGKLWGDGNVKGTVGGRGWRGRAWRMRTISCEKARQVLTALWTSVKGRLSHETIVAN